MMNRAISLLGSSFALGLSMAHAQVPAPLVQAGQATLAPMVSKVTPGVVGISVSQRAQGNPLADDPSFRRFMPDPRERRAPQQGAPEVRAAGSGVIIDAKEGLVLTNHHVVQDSSRLVVVLKDGRELDARLLGSDAGTDVALLRIAAENLTAVTVGDSDAMQVGDFVIAIGNPFGIGQTVTSGIVSALGRGLSPEGYEDYIQTDAAINPGNSGGALVNLRGELVGINTAIIGGGGEGARGGNIGIGFAVPSSMARAVIAQLLKYGEVRRGLIGIQGRDVTPRFATERKLGVTEGAFVESVDRGSPAEKSGVQVGDVVTAVNRHAVRRLADLRNQIALIPVGETLDLSYFRGSASARLVKMTVAPVGAPQTASGVPARGQSAGGTLAGASFATGPNGLVAASVDNGSPAHTLGVRTGDIVAAIDQQPVVKPEELAKVLASAGRHVLAIKRGDTKLQLVVQPRS